jgi:hypothetical protein
VSDKPYIWYLLSSAQTNVLRYGRDIVSDKPYIWHSKICREFRLETKTSLATITAQYAFMLIAFEIADHGLMPDELDMLRKLNEKTAPESAVKLS